MRSSRLIMSAIVVGVCLLPDGFGWRGLDSAAAVEKETERPASAATVEAPRFSEQDLEFFEKQVRPILVTRCYECHGPDADEPKGGLRVDSRAAILTGGDTGPAAVAGELDKSLLIDAIRYGDIYQMPPKSRMPADEVAVLERWVKLGLPWPMEAGDSVARDEKKFDLSARRAAHWAWRPVTAAQVPAVSRQDWPASAAAGSDAVSTNIDRFILARLEAAQLKPAPRADRSALLRRVYFDLIGLPPTADEARAFLADQSPDALAKVVDRLLASPHFGERWGRHWLDLARYAESRGHEFDYSIPNVWQYRDYVIRAFNADTPYDQFVREHIAGDLLPAPRRQPETGSNESILGTGFWFLGEWVHSPVDIRKDETDRLDNMIDVATKTFLALTVSCARCHDHKFDAISQADYYALAGYLKSSSYRLACFETSEHNREIAERLEALDARHAPLLAKSLMELYRPTLARMDDYLVAARETLVAVPDAPTAGAGQGLDLLAGPAERRSDEIARLAKERRLEPEVLQAWVETLTIARKEPYHPLHAFALLATEEKLSGDSLARLLEPTRKRLEERELSRGAALGDARVIVDYATVDPTDFLPDDVSFGSRPVALGELLLGDQPGKPIAGAQRHGAARRAAIWSRLKPAAGAEGDPGRLSGWVRAGQTIRTPSFALTHGRLFYLVEGQGHIYANVASHVTNNGPLHGQLVARFETKAGAGPTWVEQNLSAYSGQTLHVEFSAAGDRDVSVLMVVESRQSPGVLLPAVEMSLEPLRGAFTSLAELARNYQRLFATLADDIAQQRLSTGERIAARAELADWLVSQDRLFVSRAALVESEYLRLGEAYQQERGALLAQVKPQSQLAMAMQEGTGQDELLLIRGNSRTPGEAVPRRFLSALGGDEMSAPPTGSGRLQLAEKIAAADNPLTARVMVNRLWHHLLGRGLVASVDNFGVLGEPPSHPELLDYLASEFVARGWSIKRMIRSIVLSETYQLSSRHEPHADERDPANLLWHRANVRRLEGEAIRDALLAVSGRLDRQMYGPSVPVHLTEFMQGRGRPAGGPVDGAGRRSVYISIRRNFLSPMMLAFDMPIPFNTVGRRNVSNVPAQALILMNDPLVVDQARLWARRVLALPDKSVSERVERMYLEAFARPPSAEEARMAEAFFQQQAAELKLSEDQSITNETVWVDFAHVLFNAKEFIFLP